MAIIALVFSSSISLLAGILSYMTGFGLLASLFIWLCTGSTVMVLMLQRYMTQNGDDMRHFNDEIEADIMALNSHKISAHSGATSRN